MINEIEDQIKWDEYFIPGTDVLKNNLDITSKEKLKEAEYSIVRKKLAYLYLKPMEGKFDIEHLLNLHKVIFEDIYPFAGQLRTCTMQKTTIFCNPDEIQKSLKEILNEMNLVFSQDITHQSLFAFKLAKYYHDLIYVHPFREGNGRTIRAFLRDFVLEKSKNLSCGQLDLDYTRMDANNLFLGTVRRSVYHGMLEMEFMNGLVSVEKTDKANKTPSK